MIKDDIIEMSGLEVVNRIESDLKEVIRQVEKGKKYLADVINELEKLGDNLKDNESRTHLQEQVYILKGIDAWMLYLIC